MKTITLILIFIISVTVYATAHKENNGGLVSGTIIENNSNIKLKDVTIYLKDKSNNTTISKAISNEIGIFTIPITVSGIFTLSFSKNGYQNKIIDSIIIANNNSIVDLRKIVLTKNSTQLNEVVIASKKNTLEITTEKTIYNVENDISSQNGNAADILKKMPQVSQNADGSIELMGNTSLQFLIDGKTSTMFNGNSIDALQSIPSNQIQKIEIITSPTSKFDANGSGGVINIILKKSKVEGYSLFINTSIGTRIENGTINLNYNHKKTGINFIVSGNDQIPGNTPSGSTRNILNSLGNEYLQQENKAIFGRSNYKVNSTFNYKISDKSEIQSNANINISNSRTEGLIHQNDLQFAGITSLLLSNIPSIRNTINTTQQSTYEVNLKFLKKINDKGDVFSILALLSDSYNQNYYSQQQFYPTNQFANFGTSSYNPGHFIEKSLSIDYTLNNKKKIIWENGFKYGQQLIESDIYSYQFDSSFQNKLYDISTSNKNGYNRTILAAYSQVSKQVNSFELKLGIRYEYTISNPWFSTSRDQVRTEYGNIAPSILLAHKFEQNKFIKFSYAYRIERPDYKDLNPFINFSDPHNIITGNPLLKTEIGNNYELSFVNSKNEKTSYLATLFMQYNSPDIKPYILFYPTYKIGDSIYQNITVSTRGNISAETRYGLNLSGSYELHNLNIRPSFMIFNRHLFNQIDTSSLNGFGFRGSVNVSYKFNQELAGELFGNYNLGMKWQGQQASNYSYTIAFRRQKRGSSFSYGLILVNIFNPFIHQVTITDTKTIQMTSYKDVPYRSIGFTVALKIGGIKIVKQKEGDSFLLSPPEN